jgi:hypothetical protein
MWQVCCCGRQTAANHPQPTAMLDSQSRSHIIRSHLCLVHACAYIRSHGHAPDSEWSHECVVRVGLRSGPGGPCARPMASAPATAGRLGDGPTEDSGRPTADAPATACGLCNGPVEDSARPAADAPAGGLRSSPFGRPIADAPADDVLRWFFEEGVPVEHLVSVDALLTTRSVSNRVFAALRRRVLVRPGRRQPPDEETAGFLAQLAGARQRRLYHFREVSGTAVVLAGLGPFRGRASLTATVVGFLRARPRPITPLRIDFCCTHHGCRAVLHDVLGVIEHFEAQHCRDGALEERGGV